MLVLLITTLLVDRVVRRRQLRDRGQVTAAQAASVARQARRATDLVRAALTDGTQRDAASDELRTLMTMLLVSAPILIDAAPARTFLESAQVLAALLSRTLRVTDDGSSVPPGLSAQLDRADAAVTAAAQPLISMLDRAQLTAVDDDADDDGTDRDPPPPPPHDPA